MRWKLTIPMVCVCVGVSAQNFCATGYDSPNVLQQISPGELKASGDAYVVRIFVHVMRKSDGTGGQTQQEVNNALNVLVSDFTQHNICFSLLGIGEISDDNLYDQSIFDIDENGDGKFDNFTPDSHADAIDIYLFANDKLNFGLASAIPSIALVIGGAGGGVNFASSHVLSHEMGHCLGLFHTFHGLCEGGCEELVDGSNCSTCGDFVCDTPADPQKMEVNQNTCDWNGTTCQIPDTDSNGDTYNPDLNSIMAYVPPNCMQYFTSGQGTRLRSIIANSGLLENVLVPDNIVINSLSVNLDEDILYDVQHTLTATDDVSVISGGKLTLRAGNEIILLSGFEAVNGSYFHAYIDDQCSTIGQNNSAKLDSSGTENVAIIEEIIDTVANHNEFGFSIFPNPSVSNEAVTIGYTLSGLCSVSIALYDNSGRKVSVLLDRHLQQAGNHTFSFFPNESLVGISLCKMETYDVWTGRRKMFSPKIIRLR